MDHAMQCVARLTRAFLGASAIADSKLECGEGLTVLGVELTLSQHGCLYRPARSKAEKCMRVIRAALDEDVLRPGDAQKLAGRLSWSTQFLFRKLGRAMIRPIFQQRFVKSGRISKQLDTSLRWWLWVLQCEIAEELPWKRQCIGKVAHLFVDARSTPPRCAAVLCVDGILHYTDGAPSARVLSRLQERADGQIMSLEILAIAVGLSTFAKELCGRSVVVYSDNRGAEVWFSSRALGY